MTRLPEFNTLTEDDLTMPRQKSRSLLATAAYLFKRQGRFLLGRERSLRIFLETSRIAWRIAYELAIDVYGEDFEADSRSIEEDFLCSHIPTDGAVLDIGCGTGNWSLKAAKYAKRVVGIDYDKSKILRAQERAKGISNIQFINGDVMEILKDDQFDLAILSHVLEHIDEPETILRNLKAISKRLMIEVPDFESDPLNIVRVAQGISFYNDGDHVREYTVDILLNQLAESGWRASEQARIHNGIRVVAVNENDE